MIVYWITNFTTCIFYEDDFNYEMNYVVAFGIFLIGNHCVQIITLNRRFYNSLFNSVLVSTDQGYGEWLF